MEVFLDVRDKVAYFRGVELPSLLTGGTEHLSAGGEDGGLDAASIGSKGLGDCVHGLWRAAGGALHCGVHDCGEGGVVRRRRGGCGGGWGEGGGRVGGGWGKGGRGVESGKVAGVSVKCILAIAGR